MLRTLALACTLALAAGAVQAQDAAQPQEEVLNAPAAAQPTGQPEWQVLSRSQRMAYLFDPSTIQVRNGVTEIQLARAPLSPTGDEPAWTLETYEFRCSANQYRTTRIAEFSADGSAAGPPESLDESFEAVAANGLSGFLKGAACDDERANPPYHASLPAWIAAGRR